MELRNEDESKKQFLEYIKSRVDYWYNIERKTKKEAMNGLVYSILLGIDGESGGLPPYELKPCVSSPDGEEWLKCGLDIAGSLHESWNKYR